MSSSTTNGSHPSHVTGNGVSCGATGGRGNTTWTSHGVQLASALCVCVVGGGNIGGTTAAWLSRPGKNLCVHALTRQPQKWIRNVRVRANPLCRWGSLEPFESNIHMYV